MVTSANSHTPTQLGHESDALSASDGEIVSQHKAVGGRTDIGFTHLILIRDNLPHLPLLRDH